MQKIILTLIALTLWLQATPQTLNNMELITNMEKFTPVCKYYIGVIKNHKIKSLCRQYDKKLNKGISKNPKSQPSNQEFQVF